MPTGKTHRAITIIATVAVSCAILATTLGVDATLYYAAGGAVGLVITPDADIDTKDSVEHKLLREIPLIGAAWYALWWPYARMFRHRGVSHWLVIGTLTRLLYLGFFATFAVLALRLDVVPGETWICPAVWGLGGLLVSDVLHTVVDTI